jgi:hypothetical protein
VKIDALSQLTQQLDIHLQANYLRTRSAETSDESLSDLPISQHSVEPSATTPKATTPEVGEQPSQSVAVASSGHQDEHTVVAHPVVLSL